MGKHVHFNTLAGISLRAFLAFVLVLISSGVAAQTQSSPATDDLEIILHGSELGAEAAAGIDQIFADAGSAEIPAEFLLPRLREGISKGVAAGLIQQALEDEIERFSSAREIIIALPGGAGILQDRANWIRAANFLGSGQTKLLLSDLARATVARPETFRPATLLYLSITEWGIEPAIAIQLVQAAVDSRLDPEAFAELPGLLADAQRSRMDIDEAAIRLSEELVAGRSLRQIARTLRR